MRKAFMRLTIIIAVFLVSCAKDTTTVILSDPVIVKDANESTLFSINDLTLTTEDTSIITENMILTTGNLSHDDNVSSETGDSIPLAEGMTSSTEEHMFFQKSIYVISWALGNYSTMSLSAIKKAGNELYCDVRIMGITNDNNFDEQNNLLSIASILNADAIVIAPVNFEEQAKSVSEVYQTGIPVVLVGEMVDTEDYSAFISTDEVNAGRTAAKELIESLRDSGLDENEFFEIAIQITFENAVVIGERLHGVKEYWDENAPDKWVLLWDDIRTNDSKYEKAIDVTFEFLNNYPNMKGMLSLTSVTASGSATALMEACRTDISLVGFGWSYEVEDMIHKGYNACMIQNNKDYLSYESVRIALELANGAKLDEKVIDVGVIVINSENIDSEEVQAIRYW